MSQVLQSFLTNHPGRTSTAAGCASTTSTKGAGEPGRDAARQPDLVVLLSAA